MGCTSALTSSCPGPRLLHAEHGQPKRCGQRGCDPQSAGWGSDAHLGFDAPGGNSVSQCRVIAFGLIGVGLAEVGYGLVELP
jgi:hypothetical protein